MNLRKAAAGEPCEIRVPNVCRGDPDYTVLAHVRIVGISGAGLKAPDVIAALGCDRCHDLCDGRTPSLEYTYDQRRLMLLEGMARTQARRIEQGYILTKGERESAPPKLSKIVPRRLPSMRVCPKCKSRTTKIFSLGTGKYQCQICNHEYGEGAELLPEAHVSPSTEST